MANANSTVISETQAEPVFASSDLESASQSDFSEMKNVEFDAVFTREQIEEYESEYNTTWGVSRRTALMFLSLNKAEMIEKFGKDDGPDVLLDSVEIIQEYKEHLEAEIKLAEAAIARMICAASVLIPDDGDE
mgnify:CR=1 FL=1